MSFKNNRELTRFTQKYRWILIYLLSEISQMKNVYIPHDTIYAIFQKMQNYINKKIGGCEGLEVWKGGHLELS